MQFSKYFNMDRCIGLGIFLTVLTVYLITLCPTLYWGDCGELATAAYYLGITHPTGYPVWCLLGKLWTCLVPHGSIVWRLNTMSAFFGALAAGCFYGFMRCSSIPRSIAVAAAGMLAFSFTLWQQSLFCETYSMTAFYACLLLFLATRWAIRGRQDRDLKWLAVAYGFAMTNHQTNTLFIPGFVGFILWSEPRLRRLRDADTRRAWLSTIGVGLLPLLFYLYLPIRAIAKPVISWGYPRTPYEVFYHVTGRNYASAMFHTSRHEVWNSLVQWALGLGRELHWAVIACAAVGLIALWVRQERRPLALLLSWVIFADVGYTINYNIYNAYIYFIPSYIVLSALGGAGLSAAWTLMQSGIEVKKQPAFATMAAVCILTIPAFQAVRHWHTDDLSHNWTCYDYAHNLLKTMPAGSVLIDNGLDTSTFTIEYLQNVEHYRTDVLDLRRGILMGLYNPENHKFMGMWYLRQLMERDPQMARLFLHRPLSWKDCVSEGPLQTIVADSLKTGRPVFAVDATNNPKMYVDDKHKQTIAEYLQKQGPLVQMGLLARVYAPNEKPSDGALLAETQRIWGTYRMRGVFDGIYLRDDFLTGMALDYANGDLARARLAMRLGDINTAEAAYTEVNHLFVCHEATAGLQQCEELRAKQMPRRDERAPAKAPARAPTAVADSRV